MLSGFFMDNTDRVSIHLVIGYLQLRASKVGDDYSVGTLNKTAKHAHFVPLIAWYRVSNINVRN